MLIDLPGEYSLRAAKPTEGRSGGHADDDSPTVFGFWIYMMSDCVLFAALFATYAVLSANYAGGPAGRDIFELDYVMTETFLLLISSATYGLAMPALGRRSRGGVAAWLIATFLFGAFFVGMEVFEFHKLVADGAGPGRSAFLSAFFTLVGTHGLHVTLGLVWMGVMLAQTAIRGLGGTLAKRLACLGLFWHFLDIVWICVFTVVYLTGVA